MTASSHADSRREHWTYRCTQCRGSMGSGYQKDGICRGCRTAIKERRWREIQRLWRAGCSMAEISTAIGRSENHLSTEMVRIRKAGWDLPYRYNLQG
jgi:tRNA(Ile2) C34 agmatinyltransferase TiaS